MAIEATSDEGMGLSEGKTVVEDKGKEKQGPQPKTKPEEEGEPFDTNDPAFLAQLAKATYNEGAKSEDVGSKFQQDVAKAMGVPVEEEAPKTEGSEQPKDENEPEVDWKQRYEEQLKKLGDQGNEIGDLRKELRALKSQSEEEAKAKAQKQAEAEMSTDAMGKKLYGDRRWKEIQSSEDSATKEFYEDEVNAKINMLRMIAQSVNARDDAYQQAFAKMQYESQLASVGLDKNVEATLIQEHPWLESIPDPGQRLAAMKTLAPANGSPSASAPTPEPGPQRPVPVNRAHLVEGNTGQEPIMSESEAIDGALDNMGGFENEVQFFGQQFKRLFPDIGI